MLLKKIPNKYYYSFEYYYQEWFTNVASISQHDQFELKQQQQQQTNKQTNKQTNPMLNVEFISRETRRDIIFYQVVRQRRQPNLICDQQKPEIPTKTKTKNKNNIILFLFKSLSFSLSLSLSLSLSFEYIYLPSELTVPTRHNVAWSQIHRMIEAVQRNDQ